MRLRMVRFRRLEQQALDEAAQTRFLRTLRAGVARDE